MLTPDEAERAAVMFLLEQRVSLTHAWIDRLLPDGGYLCAYDVDGLYAIGQHMVQVDPQTGACSFSRLTMVDII